MGVMTVSSQNFMEIDMPGWWLSGASVDLDFRNGRYYDSGDILTSLSKLLSISRASIGYAKTSSGVLTQFGTGVMRVTDLGLLIEDARTNTTSHSQDFVSSWSPNSAFTVVDNAATAPDGTATACSFTHDATTNTVAAFSPLNTGSITSGTQFTVSIYAKYVSGQNWLVLYFTDGGANRGNAWFDLNHGVVGSSQTAGNVVVDSTSIEPLTNGWYRCILAAHPTATMTMSLWFSPSAIADLNANSTTGVQYVWGAQLEAGAFASSYIPTTTTSATRASDSVTISGSAQTAINNATGSAVAWINGSPAPVFPANIVDSNGTNLLGYDATDHGLTSITSTLATGNTANASGRDKFGTSWDAAGRRLVLNGGTVATDAVAQTPSATQKLGSANGTSNFLYAYVDRLALWNTKLASATLQSLTT